jgi:replicative DNA helicase
MTVSPDGLSWPDVERLALGTAIVYEEHRAPIFAEMREEYFATSAHRTLFAFLRDRYEAGGSIDVYSVATELLQRGLSKAVGGIAGVSSLCEGLVRAYDPESHAATLREAWQKRELLRALADVQLKAGPATSAAELRENIETALAGTEAGAAVQNVARLGDFVLAELDAIATERKHLGDVLGIPTGVPALDRLTTGLRPGEFTVIGGRPGDGKTSLQMQMAYTAARAGFPALVISLEMRKGELARRLLALESGTAFLKLRDPRRLQAGEFEATVNAAEGLGALPLFVCDLETLDASAIASTARLWITKAGVKAVFVDFLQIVRTSDPDRRLAIGKISAALRGLAKSTRVPVVATSQLSRPKDGGANTRPTLFSLRESGEIEQDAHTVLLLYRPKDDQGEPTGEDEILIGKQRNGMTGSVPVRYDDLTLHFRERHA